MVCFKFCGLIFHYHIHLIDILKSILKAALLHGDMHQDDRNLTINNFKKSDLPILVATDVAGNIFKPNIL